MHASIIKLVLFIAGLVLIDIYILSGVKGLPAKWRFIHKESFTVNYWLFSAFLLIGVLFVSYVKVSFGLRLGVLVLFILLLFFKLCAIPFLALDDLRRLVIYLKLKIKRPAGRQLSLSKPDDIPRSAFFGEGRFTGRGRSAGLL